MDNDIKNVSMLREKVKDEMDNFVDAIYECNIEKTNKNFIIFIDCLMEYIDILAKTESKIIDINGELTELENAYISKDYILTADIVQDKIYAKL